MEVGGMTLMLRDYQERAVEALRQGIRDGHKRQIICSPTGSGKTICAIHLVQEALSKGSKTAFIVDKLSLLYQTEARFDEYRIPFGVIQAGHYRWRPWERLQLCSSQTLARRGIMDDLKFIIVDEANTCYKSTMQFLQKHPDVIAVGLDAAPFNRTLGTVYSNVVNITTTNELMDQGWLVKPRVFVAKAIDVQGVKVSSTGEWDTEELANKGRAIIGDVVSEWVEKTQAIFGGPVKTIAFSPNVDYGEELCARWRDAGFNFINVSYKDGNDEGRRQIIEEFRKPDSSIMGLVSCYALAKGFDCPDVLCGVDAHPFRKSLSSVIQQLGRVLRPSPGKSTALWLDHAGNYVRFNDDITTFFAEGLKGLKDDHLDSTARKEKTAEEKKDICCVKCGAVLLPSQTVCPNCGKERQRRKQTVDEVAGELIELRNGVKVEKWLADKESVAGQIWYYALEKKHGDRDAARRFAAVQFKELYGHWCTPRIDQFEPRLPDIRLVARIKHNLIRWARRRNAP